MNNYQLFHSMITDPVRVNPKDVDILLPTNSSLHHTLTGSTILFLAPKQGLSSYPFRYNPFFMYTHACTHSYTCTPISKEYKNTYLTLPVHSRAHLQNHCVTLTFLDPLGSCLCRMRSDPASSW